MKKELEKNGFEERSSYEKDALKEALEILDSEELIGEFDKDGKLVKAPDCMNKARFLMMLKSDKEKRAILKSKSIPEEWKKFFRSVKCKRFKNA